MTDKISAAAHHEASAFVVLGNVLQALDDAGAPMPSPDDDVRSHEELGEAVYAPARVRLLAHRIADLCWEIGELRAAHADLVDTIERAKRSRTQKGGQQAPYHGDFAQVTPSVAIALDYWAKRLSVAGKPGGEGKP